MTRRPLTWSALRPASAAGELRRLVRAFRTFRVRARGAPAGARRSARRGRRAGARGATVPPWDSATARTIERPRPLEPPRSLEPRKKRSKTLSRSSCGMPGPSSSTASTTTPSTRSTGASTAVPGSVCRSAFSIRFRTSRCSSSRAPSTTIARRRRRSRSRGRRRRARARRRPRSTIEERSTGSCAATRPASARASSSRSATRRRMRREERRAEAAASRCSPSRSSSSSSRLASTEVSGVRSSCEASATNSRWRASVASVSARASSSALSIDSSVRASSATSSSASGRGIRTDGSRVRSTSRAALGQLGDRLHRAPRGGQAGQQREQGAAQHAEGQEDLHAVGGRLHVGEPPGVLDDQRAAGSRSARRGATRPASRRRSACWAMQGPKFGAPRLPIT